MNDLIAFYAARLDEDEAAAKACADFIREIGWKTDDDIDGWSVGAHPMRDLREVAAKRAILASLAEDGRCLDRGYTDLTRGAQLVMLGVVRRLAAVHRDHPDYRAEWAPQTV